MVSIVDAIIGIICIIFLDIVETVVIMAQIRFSAKRKWNKNYKAYPYFHYSLYRKVFFVGLKGALNPVAVVFAFVAHIVTILVLITGIMVCFMQELIISYIFRILIGLGSFLFTIRGVWQFAFPLNL